MSSDYIRSIQLRFYFLSFLILANSAQAACVGSDVVICSGSSSVAYTNSVSITSLTLETGGAITSPIDKAIINYANIGTLTNNGTIAGSAWYGIWNWYWSTPVASIGTIINNGIIYGPSYGIFNEIGTIGTITNIGTIYGGGTAGKWGIVIDNSTASLSVLNNLQGQSNTYGALNYAGKLPTNYNIIISPTSFGQLAVTGGTGITAFGIYAGSKVTSGVYADVLQGLVGSLSGSSITGTGFSITGTTGSYGGFNYSLVADTAITGMWNLVFASTSTNILSSSGNTLSSVGSSLNPTFDGGTLTLANGDNSNQAFTVNSTGGTITSPAGGSATLSGVFSGAGAMTFNGTGTTYMNGVNTYTGGTTVASGTLSVGSDESNKAARLAGNVTVASGAILAGHGGIGGTVTNSGRVAPGGSIGTLSIAGNYVQTSGASLSTSITPTTNSVLAVVGTASLAGGFVIDAASGAYAKKTYTVLTSTGLTGKFSSISGNLASYSSLNSSLSYDANNAYLTLSSGTDDTQQSLVNTASVLQGIYTLQNTVLANSFSYDCTVFGANDVCISAGGRNTAVQAAGMNNTSGLLIAAYRPHPSYRMGAYADQNLSTNSPGGTVKLGNNTSLIGAFAAWNERLDGTGAEIKVSAAYGQKNATVTRAVVGTSDPGTGSSNLISQGAQITAKYGFAVIPEMIVSPYLGMRYTQNNMAGYTESTSSSVTAPLTYSALNTNATTALAGVGASYRVIPQVMTFVSAGVETDTNTANGTYSATNSSIGTLTAVNFNANPVRTRPTATVGAYYDIEKNQRLGITGIYRQEAYQAVSTTTVMATYTVGL